MATDSKLETFKTAINLVEYATVCGYGIVKGESSRNSAVMKNAAGDKIIVARNANGHWMYFSVRDDSDNGTIIDFVLRRKGANNMGRVKGELAAWLDGSAYQEQRRSVQCLELLPSSRDRQRVVRAMAAMQSVEEHPYLVGRGLGREIAGDPRFRGRVFLDGRRNAVFSHHDDDGLCGYEIKNRGFTGFAPGGEKGLWESNGREGDAALILAESAIDAMSYFAVTRREGVYASTAGEWNPKTPGLILGAVARLPAGSSVVLAFDNDDQGHKYVAQVTELIAGRGHLIEVDQPIREGEDWNDHLRRSKGISSSGRAQNRVQRGLGRTE